MSRTSASVAGSVRIHEFAVGAGAGDQHNAALGRRRVKRAFVGKVEKKTLFRCDDVLGLERKRRYDTVQPKHLYGI